MAGLAGVTLTAGSVLNRVALPEVAAESRPAAFIASAFALRARIATSGEPGLLEQIYERSSIALRFERERAQYMLRGLNQRWDGTVLEHRSSITPVLIEVNGSEAHARVNEQLESFWVQNVHPLTAEIEKLRRDNPGKYARTPQGPQGEVRSVAVIPHEVWLTRVGADWRISRHAHDEFFHLDRSPDLLPGAWAAIIYGRPRLPKVALPTMSKGPGLAKPLAATYYYYPGDARWYAQQFATSPNSQYCNYNSCGGDCTNFVSQAAYYGGEIKQGAWSTFSGACGTCGTTSSYAGTDTWANVEYMRNFMLNNGGRATEKASVSALGYGDHIDYQWDSGWYDHKTIITGSPFSSQPLVCSHSPFLLDHAYDTSPLNGAVAYKYIWMNTTYTA